jgi:hypothetical protein
LTDYYGMPYLTSRFSLFLLPARKNMTIGNNVCKADCIKVKASNPFKMGITWQVLLTLLVISSLLGNNFLACAQSEDYYCGTTMEQAVNECPLACPTGQDSECSSGLGSDFVCYYFTGCAEKIANGFVPAGVADASGETVTDAPVLPVAGSQSPTTTQTSGPDTAGGTETPSPAPVAQADVAETLAPTNPSTEAEL